MPSYKVIADGFHEGKLYSPTGKRQVLDTDKAFKKVPSWLVPIKGETATQAKKRRATEAAKEKAAKEKAEQDKKDIDEVTFTSSAEATTKTL